VNKRESERERQEKKKVRGDRVTFDSSLLLPSWHWCALEKARSVLMYLVHISCLMAVGTLLAYKVPPPVTLDARMRKYRDPHGER